ncbi:MAG: hypothetical protein WC247_13060, partial [Porticoccaceae bacterium]
CSSLKRPFFMTSSLVRKPSSQVLAGPKIPGQVNPKPHQTSTRRISGPTDQHCGTASPHSSMYAQKDIDLSFIVHTIEL